MRELDDIRLSLPSKGQLGQRALDLLADCGLEISKSNPRRYAGCISALPDLTVILQRPGDIVVSVRDGSVDFGITGMDLVAERGGDNGALLILHESLGFGRCRLCLAVPEEWGDVHTVADLEARVRSSDAPLRVATKFPHLTGDFLTHHGVRFFTLVDAEGALEVAPTIGYADVVCDLVSTGQTLHDNRFGSRRFGPTVFVTPGGYSWANTLSRCWAIT